MTVASIMKKNVLSMHVDQTVDEGRRAGIPHWPAVDAPSATGCCD